MIFNSADVEDLSGSGRYHSQHTHKYTIKQEIHNESDNPVIAIYSPPA